MRTCPTCHRKVSETAMSCPGCGEDFVELRKREADATKIGIILFIVGVILAAVVLLILSPGIVVNLIMGRFKNDPQGFLWASVLDAQTWIVSLSVWVFLLCMLYVVKRRKNLLPPSGSPAAQAEIAGDPQPDTLPAPAPSSCPVPHRLHTAQRSSRHRIDSIPTGAPARRAPAKSLLGMQVKTSTGLLLLGFLVLVVLALMFAAGAGAFDRL